MNALWKLAIVVGLVAVGVSFCGIYRVINEVHRSLNYADLVAKHITKDTLRLFKNFDQDDDNYLDIFEFQAARRYVEKRVENKASAEDGAPNGLLNHKLLKEKLLNATVAADEEYVTVKASFQPLDLDSMSAFSKKRNDHGGVDRMYDIHTEGLRKWAAPFINELNFTCQDLKVFLPGSKKSVGDVWNIVLPITSKYEPGLSHNRYQQEAPMSDREQTLTNLLTMFGPAPFLLNRFAPQGTMAVLRAFSKDYLDIVFRMHAEFQINEPPNFPFWFSPAQFTGNIIISNDGKHVEDFTLYVPNDKKLNVDMEWITGKKKIIDQPNDPWEMEVDIGYIPEMALHIDGPSHKVGELVKEKQLINWEKEISESQARRLLQKKFYPFQEIRYYPFNITYEKANEESKLVHQILLWGSLDDQSC